MMKPLELKTKNKTIEVFCGSIKLGTIVFGTKDLCVHSMFNDNIKTYKTTDEALEQIETELKNFIHETTGRTD